MDVPDLISAALLREDQLLIIFATHSVGILLPYEIDMVIMLAFASSRSLFTRGAATRQR